MSGDEACTARPGWWGKLPGAGDFLRRRLPDAFVAPWDAWLQRELARVRAQHADWARGYLGAPLWRFALGAGVAGPQAWRGVLMPSVDQVGRYFPLTIAAPHGDGDGEAPDAGRWWHALGAAALEGLQHDLDAARFEAALARHLALHTAPAAPAASVLAPSPGQSAWHEGTGAPRYCMGLPTGLLFDALFDQAPTQEPV